MQTHTGAATKTTFHCNTSAISHFSSLYRTFYFCYCKLQTVVSMRRVGGVQQCPTARWKQKKTWSVQGSDTERLRRALDLLRVTHLHKGFSLGGNSSLPLLLPPLLVLYLFLRCNAVLHFFLDPGNVLPQKVPLIVERRSGCLSTAASAPIPALVSPFLLLPFSAHPPASFFFPLSLIHLPLLQYLFCYTPYTAPFSSRHE